MLKVGGSSGDCISSKAIPLLLGFGAGCAATFAIFGHRHKRSPSVRKTVADGVQIDHKFNKDSALIVIDFQKEYVSEGTACNMLETFPCLQRNVSNVLACARERNLEIIFVRQDESGFQNFWPWWTQLHPAATLFDAPPRAEPWACEQLSEVSNEHVFIKTSFDCFTTTPMHSHLQQRAKKRVYLMGCLTKACVMQTAHSAFNLGYEVFVLEDCCGDTSVQDHEAALNLYNGYNICVVKSQDCFGDLLYQ